MFDLEKSITEWRTQMSVSIKNPSTLDELENHLREETEKQKQAGANESAAFDFAVQKIGRASQLKAEFKKVGGRTFTTNRVLGLLWFIYCAGSFYKVTNGLLITDLFTNKGIYFPDLRWNAFFFLALLMDLIYLRGLIASVLLFGGAMRERRFILLLAILDFVGGIIFMFKSFQPLSFAFTILGFITLCLFWPRRKIKTATE